MKVKSPLFEVSDCINDTGYLADFANVDFQQLPKLKQKSKIIRWNYNEKTCFKQGQPETETTSDKNDQDKDECSHLKEQVNDLTREIDQMKTTMTEKMKQQVAWTLLMW